MKIVFLDLDGVLNTLQPHEHSGPWSKAACSNLNTLLHKSPDLRIVISSSHRKHGIAHCRKLLQDQGIDPIKVIDTLGPQEEIGKLDREELIKEWLSQHLSVKDFVIFDDYFSMPKYKKHFVKTNSYVGLTGADVDKALVILNGKP